MDDEINLLDYWRVIVKRKWLIIGLALLSAFSTFVYSLKQPKFYKATATIMSVDTGGGGLASALAAVPFLGGGGGGGSESKLIPILKSRALAKEVAKIIEPGLILPMPADNLKLTEEERLRSIAGNLMGSIDAKMGTSGLLEITATWTDPEVAAEVANKYTQGLGIFLSARAFNFNYQLIDAAVPSTAPFNRNSRQKAMNGLGVGLFLGIFLAFIQEYWQKLKQQS